MRGSGHAASLMGWLPVIRGLSPPLSHEIEKGIFPEKLFTPGEPFAGLALWCVAN
ncbi:hypothetical protein CSC33_4191 [Pseudomonas aeruginosa]|nr:hypothetical protein CSC33_4191 [Pseudomonas aeruginosa]